VETVDALFWRGGGGDAAHPDRERPAQTRRRHGGGQARFDIQEMEIASPVKDDELLAVSDALGRFAVRDKPKAELVKLLTSRPLQRRGCRGAWHFRPDADRWWKFQPRVAVERLNVNKRNRSRRDFADRICLAISHCLVYDQINSAP